MRIRTSLKSSTQDAKPFAEFIASEITKWGKVIRDANIKLD